MKGVVIRDVRSSDLPLIAAVIGDWQKPVESNLEPIRDALAGKNDWKFFVAEDSGKKVVGVIGLATSGIDPELVKNGRAAELVSAYVAKASRGTGVGRALADKVEEVAVELGFDTLLIVSGSRNRESGYPFWSRRYGQPVRVDEDYFAPGAERVVWSKKLMLKGVVSNGQADI